MVSCTERSIGYFPLWYLVEVGVTINILPDSVIVALMQALGSHGSGMRWSQHDRLCSVILEHLRYSLRAGNLEENTEEKEWLGEG